jgi:hypothetical protein
MKFGVFDHMDRSGPDLGQQYRDRLALVEAYDRAGFYGSPRVIGGELTVACHAGVRV